MKTRCRFERAIESLKTSVHESGKKGYTTLLAAGIVNPFGPTLSVLAVDGYFPLADGRIPLIEMMLNPFAQSCTIVGTVDMGDNWTPLYDLQPFTSLPLRSCPTLLLPSQFMAPDTVESLYADLLMTFDHGDRVLSSVRQYPGDPWTRIQAEIDDSLSGETSGSPFAPPKSGTSRLNRSEATELARTQLAPENLRPEVLAFLDAWRGSVEFQAAAGASTAMPFDRFLDIFALLAMSCSGLDKFN